MSTWLAERIATGGPITVDAFMRACLTDPAHGYYRRSQAIGATADFITAPEISQIFGELIGIWVAASWQALGEPSSWRLIELGPGRGTLMADMLQALKVVPQARAGVTVMLVEVNQRLRAEQRAKLVGCGVDIAWCDAVGPEVVPMPTIVIANEFLDALPIRQLVARNGQWHERMVSLATATSRGFMGRAPSPSRLAGERAGVRGGAVSDATATAAQAPALAAEPAPAPHPPFEHPLSSQRAEGRGGVRLCFDCGDCFDIGDMTVPAAHHDGAICELMTGATDLIEDIAAALAGAPCYHLYIDYGHLGPVPGDTLQAVSAHRYADPLAAPGEHDLSAQVDFAQIAAAAQANGLTAHGPITQGKLLGRLGAAQRLERLAANQDARTLLTLHTGLARLMDPSGMGARFKALALASPGLAVPVVF